MNLNKDHDVYYTGKDDCIFVELRDDFAVATNYIRSSSVYSRAQIVKISNPGLCPGTLSHGFLAQAGNKVHMNKG